MKVPSQVLIPSQSRPPALVSTGTRIVVALAVVCATAASVWLGDTVTSSLPHDLARSSDAVTATRLVSLPTVVIVGRRDSLDEVAANPRPVDSAAVSSVDPQDLSPGRVKFRQ